MCALVVDDDERRAAVGNLLLKSDCGHGYMPANGSGFWISPRVFRNFCSADFVKDCSSCCFRLAIFSSGSGGASNANVPAPDFAIPATLLLKKDASIALARLERSSRI